MLERKVLKYEQKDGKNRRQGFISSKTACSTKSKEKRRVEQRKKAEKAKRASKNILFGASICKVLGIDYTKIDEYLPSVIGYLDLKKQNLRNSVYADRGNELLESWKNGGDRNE